MIFEVLIYSQIDFATSIIGIFVFQKMLFEKFYMFIKINCYQKNRAEIHQALLSQFSLLVEFFIGKVTVRA